MTRFYVPIVALLAIAACSSTKPKTSSGDEIIYKANTGGMVEVFNIRLLRFSNEGVGYLSRLDQRYSEWGGSIEFCSDEQFYCLAGGINVAVPRHLDKSQWEFFGRACRLESEGTTGNALTIVCRFKEFSATRFVYSRDGGIISYRRLKSYPEIEFELVGEKGLFAESRTSD